MTESETMMETLVRIPHVIKGVVDSGADLIHSAGDTGFATPAIDVNDLVWPRAEPLPSAEAPVREIIDFLAAVADRLRDDTDAHLQSVVDALVPISPYERRILEHIYSMLWQGFTPERTRALLDNELGGPDVIDSWRPMSGPGGRHGAVRAYPTRVVHVLAGNSPGVAATTIARGALMKGVHLLKMPSNDLLTATALLRTMIAVDPTHPTVRSFSAVYWRGGDSGIEGALLRPQYFDKIVAWGGETAILNAAKHLAPGLELIAFDPKNSISIVGREAFESDETLAEVATLAAIDATALNQEACVASRFQFVEGTAEQVDRYCELLQSQLRLERPTCAEVVERPPADVRSEIEALRWIGDPYRVFGVPDGSGTVVRSDEPVDFYPSGKTVNVVPVSQASDAVRYVNVSTQTVSMYPATRKASIRDQLASAGVQRVVNLGQAHGMIPGFPHDGFYPMHRMVRWVNDED